MLKFHILPPSSELEKKESIVVGQVVVPFPHCLTHRTDPEWGGEAFNNLPDVRSHMQHNIPYPSKVRYTPVTMGA